eukprot:4924028-Pyramimonas_sp.AAC.1
MIQGSKTGNAVFIGISDRGPNQARPGVNCNTIQRTAFRIFHRIFHRILPADRLPLADRQSTPGLATRAVATLPT